MRYFTVDEANEVARRIRPLLMRLVNALRSAERVDEEEFEEILNAVIGEARREGFIIRDLMLGIVDFPTMTVDGREAYLCWVVDEPEVAYWHGPEGFVGRRPIVDKGLFVKPAKELD